MNNIIAINGVIGFDVTANDIRNALKEANGQPIEAEIGSPGGMIVEGIEIYNLIRHYKGQTTARIMGMAASMAAIIPLAFDKIEAYSNSVYFLHQAITTIFDANKEDLQYRIGVLTGFDNILISALMSKSGRKREEVELLMKNEVFIFGSDIKENGFADVIIDSEEEIEKDLAVTNAMSEFYACQEKIKTEDQQIDKIAAYLNQDGFTTPVRRPAFSNIQTGENSMDIKTFEAELPDVYKAVFNRGKAEGEAVSSETAREEGKAAGILEERARIAGIEAFASMPADFKAKARAENWQPEQAASEYLKADEANRKAVGDGITADLKEPIASDVPKEAVDPVKPVDESAMTPDQKWEASAGLQAEYGGDIDRYKAFLKADGKGRVKILNRRDK